MNLNPKMDQTKIPAPVRKLIAVAKYDLMERYAIKQYIDESSTTLGNTLKK